MNTKEIVSRKNNTITTGEVTTDSMGAGITVEQVDLRDHTVQITIEQMWFDAAALRETAKLFKKMADVLDVLEAQ